MADTPDNPHNTRSGKKRKIAHGAREETAPQEPPTQHHTPQTESERLRAEDLRRWNALELESATAYRENQIAVPNAHPIPYHPLTLPPPRPAVQPILQASSRPAGFFDDSGFSNPVRAQTAQHIPEAAPSSLERPTHPPPSRRSQALPRRTRKGQSKRTDSPLAHDSPLNTTSPELPQARLEDQTNTTTVRCEEGPLKLRSLRESHLSTATAKTPQGKLEEPKSTAILRYTCDPSMIRNTTDILLNTTTTELSQKELDGLHNRPILHFNDNREQNHMIYNLPVLQPLAAVPRLEDLFQSTVTSQRPRSPAQTLQRLLRQKSSDTPPEANLQSQKSQSPEYPISVEALATLRNTIAHLRGALRVHQQWKAKVIRSFSFPLAIEEALQSLEKIELAQSGPEEVTHRIDQSPINDSRIPSAYYRPSWDGPWRYVHVRLDDDVHFLKNTLELLKRMDGFLGGLSRDELKEAMRELEDFKKVLSDE